MDIVLNIIVLDRSSAPHTAGGGLRTKKVMRSFDWRISMDAVGSVTSTFRVVENIRNSNDIVAGDIIIVNQAMGMFGNRMIDGPEPATANHTRGLYFGVVDTYTEDTLTCRDLSSVFNVVNLLTSNSPQESNNPDAYIIRLMQQVQQTPGAQLGFVTYRRGANTGIAWSKTIDRPVAQNISQVISSIFTYNQVVATPHFYLFNHVSNPPTTQIEIYVRHETKSNITQLNLADAETFHEVDIFVQERNVGSPNILRVWDENGQERDTWARLINNQGEVSVESFLGVPSEDIISRLDMPVVMSAVVARIDDENPFDEARARETLTGNEYRHTITFRYNVQGELGNSLLLVGKFVKLFYEQQEYDSIITAWTINSETNLATVTCGNIRSSLQSFIGY